MAANGRTRKDVALTLTRNMVKVNYEDIPAEAIDVTKKSILDTLGVIIGASGVTPGLKELVELVREGGGTEESTILSFGDKVPAWMAAFVNGAMAHCLDYDDIHHEARTHPSAQTVPAGFAIAERLGKVKGKELITAVTLGSDLMCRLGLSVERGSWHLTMLLGGFAAAATSGKLLGLNEAKMIDALGLAYCQAAGPRQVRLGVGSDIGGMRDAFSNKAGVLSALMAKKGITGVKEILEGEAGLYNAFFGGKYDRTALITGLGQKFEGSGVGFKPWPACAGAHVHIDATLGLATEHDIQPQNIEEITVFTSDTGHGRELCEPLLARKKPMTSSDAKFSIPFTVAVAVVRREVVIKDYSLEGIQDEQVLQVAQKVTPKYDPQLRVRKGREPGIVEIRMKDGKVYSKRVDVPYGHSGKPLAWKDLIHKFKDCVSHSVKPVSGENIERVINMVAKLEEVDDVGRIIQLLS